MFVLNITINIFQSYNSAQIALKHFTIFSVYIPAYWQFCEQDMMTQMRYLIQIRKLINNSTVYLRGKSETYHISMGLHYYETGILPQNALRRDCNGKCIEWNESHYLEVVVEVYIVLIVYSINRRCLDAGAYADSLTMAFD